jgi:hypothetical protein
MPFLAQSHNDLYHAYFINKFDRTGSLCNNAKFSALTGLLMHTRVQSSPREAVNLQVWVLQAGVNPWGADVKKKAAQA